MHAEKEKKNNIIKCLESIVLFSLRCSGSFCLPQNTAILPGKNKKRESNQNYRRAYNIIERVQISEHRKSNKYKANSS